MKKILPLAYLKEIQLMKIRQIKTDDQSLNANMDIFFNLALIEEKTYLIRKELK